ncbi:aldehyde dehydrogenase family protein [Gracilimonas mengyeensis]|uniref:Aldehyde dehydrogenase (NAD+) n=1 Tax=Gracilimonas mengyeensis TaxID=1302730 RepID=A0A521CLG4_9BACT|nr:aldehyde dehydrogenase family protein [Gracilimonas mengyeensis]SMO60307.1 aldehyde dehydrogenase (NAD+) [Gracilimonas mengyeensis]
MSTYEDLDKNYINGNWKDGSGDSSVDVLNPYTKENIFSFKSSNESDVDEAYSAAKAAQKEWEKKTPSEKRNIFDRAAEIMKERKEEITDWITKESGGTKVKAETEWMIAFEALRVSANYPYEVKGEIFPSLIPGKESRMYRKPLGVITIITPWNFPLNLSMRSIAPALATGNAVVVKPAEDTPVTGATIIAKIFEEAGLPEGLFNVVLGKGSDIGDYIVEHPTGELISFTGSTPIGKRIAKKAAEQMKDVSLELGGNNAMIVLDDADLENAVDAALFGKYMHQGQICMAANRILVDEKIYDDFVEQFTEKAKALKVGDPTDPETEIGPIVNESQVEKIMDLVNEGIEAGAEPLTEIKQEGNLIHPVVLANVTNDMPVAQKEIFGPVAPIIKFSGDEEAIKLANDTSQGLSGAVHSKNTERALNVAKSIETGMIHINDQPVNDDANAVFGGEKQSGIGRFNGDFIKEEFTTTQWVTVQHEERPYAFS